jgi:hypothetical protein
MNESASGRYIRSPFVYNALAASIITSIFRDKQQLIHSSINGSTAALAAFLFSFVIICKVGTTPGTGDQPVARPLLTHITAQTQHKHIQTFISRVGIETSSPASKRAKTVYASDCAATVIHKQQLIEVTKHFI